jgi:hypothetical protein
MCIRDRDMSGRPRGDSNPDGSAMPTVADPNGSYKNERTKIAIGRYGQDEGDAEPVAGLSVVTLWERRELESQTIMMQLQSRTSASKRQSDFDRAHHGRRGWGAERGTNR